MGAGTCMTLTLCVASWVLPAHLLCITAVRLEGALVLSGYQTLTVQGTRADYRSVTTLATGTNAIPITIETQVSSVTVSILV